MLGEDIERGWSVQLMVYNISHRARQFRYRELTRDLWLAKQLGPDLAWEELWLSDVGLLNCHNATSTSLQRQPQLPICPRGLSQNLF